MPLLRVLVCGLLAGAAGAFAAALLRSRRPSPFGAYVGPTPPVESDSVRPAA
jgi:hypothetical protein